MIKEEDQKLKQEYMDIYHRYQKNLTLLKQDGHYKKEELSTQLKEKEEINSVLLKEVTAKRLER